MSELRLEYPNVRFERKGDKRFLCFKKHVSSYSAEVKFEREEWRLTHVTALNAQQVKDLSEFMESLTAKEKS